METIYNLSVNGLLLDDYIARNGISFETVQRVNRTITTMAGTEIRKWIDKERVTVSLVEIDADTKYMIESKLFVENPADVHYTKHQLQKITGLIPTIDTTQYDADTTNPNALGWLVKDEDTGIYYVTSDTSISGTYWQRLSPAGYNGKYRLVISGSNVSQTLRIKNSLKTPLNIAWGDGQSNTTSLITDTLRHVYSTPGTYELIITDSINKGGWQVTERPSAATPFVDKTYYDGNAYLVGRHARYYVSDWTPKVKIVEAGIPYYEGLSFTLEEK